MRLDHLLSKEMSREMVYAIRLLRFALSGAVKDGGSLRTLSPKG